MGRLLPPASNVDIDLFNAYKGHYGHRAGDECLRAVAGVLAKTEQRSSVVDAQYGGAKFAVIVADCDYVWAVQVAAAIRPCLRGDPRVLIRLADHALYRARRDRRNRTAIRPCETKAGRR